MTVILFLGWRADPCESSRYDVFLGFHKLNVAQLDFVLVNLLPFRALRPSHFPSLMRTVNFTQCGLRTYRISMCYMSARGLRKNDESAEDGHGLTHKYTPDCRSYVFRSCVLVFNVSPTDGIIEHDFMACLAQLGHCCKKCLRVEVVTHLDLHAAYLICFVFFCAVRQWRRGNLH